MSLVKCRVEGCPSSMEFGEKTLPDASYLCSKHPRQTQLQTLGREYDPELDEEDSEVRFQPFQFDKYLGRPTHEDDGQ